MACWAHGNGDRWQRRMERMQRRMERMQAAAGRWSCSPREHSSGNRAFDEYRTETLRRLEEEQRHARDKVEFDQFMAERGRRPNDSGSQPPAG